MTSISLDSHLRSRAKDVIWHNGVFADAGIEKFRVQLDGSMRCWLRCLRLRSRSRRLQALERSETDEDGHRDVALEPGSAAGRNPADDNSQDQGRGEE